MTTLRRLIKGSLRLINVTGTNEEPSADDMNISLKAMNGLVDSLGNDLLNIYTVKPVTFPLTPNKQTYTLGPAVDEAGNLTGADWIVKRPMRIEQARLMRNANIQMGSIPEPSGMVFSLGPPNGIILRSAQSQMTDFTDFSGFNQALSETPFDWDLDNLPAGAEIVNDTILIPDETFAVRSASFMGFPEDINPVVLCEITWDDLQNANEDVWIGVCTNGTTAVIDPAPEVLPFDPSLFAGGQYFTLYNPATGQVIDSTGNFATGAVTGPGDVIGFMFENYGPGTPVLNPDLVIYVNGVEDVRLQVPHSCFDFAVGRGQIAACITRGVPPSAE